MIIAGVDEAGRGPLAGPVMAAAVVLNPDKPILGLRDSKTVTAKKREYLFELIKENALAWAIASASVEEIDDINILQASLLAMQRAVNQLNPFPTLALVDGIYVPKIACSAKAIIDGDAKEEAISAASILAKVARDHEMALLSKQYPHYEFHKHKGYGTALHMRLLKEWGPCPIHRRSFAPVRASEKTFSRSVALI